MSPKRRAVSSHPLPNMFYSFKSPGLVHAEAEDWAQLWKDRMKSSVRWRGGWSLSFNILQHWIDRKARVKTYSVKQNWNNFIDLRHDLVNFTDCPDLMHQFSRCCCSKLVSACISLYCLQLGGGKQSSNNWSFAQRKSQLNSMVWVISRASIVIVNLRCIELIFINNLKLDHSGELRW